MNAPSKPSSRRRWPWIAGAALVLAAIGGWYWSGASRSPDAQAARRPAGATPVVTAKAESRGVPVRIVANGTVTALQSVDLRSQVTSTVREVHIREGQDVRAGALLFSLGARADDANELFHRKSVKPPMAADQHPITADETRQELDRVTGQVIGAAQRVSSVLGEGFLEKIYENALVLELKRRGVQIHQQCPVHVRYEGENIPVCLLLNFGCRRLEVRRIVHNF